MLIWKTNTSSARTASYRYRCLLPVQHLAKSGYSSVIYSRAERVYCPHRAAALVFMKSFTNEDVNTCQLAVNKGIPVILDLCDNIFIDEYAEERDLDYSPRENFRTMAAISSAIVTTGPALKQAIEAFVADPPPVWVIPDGCETLADVHYALALKDWRRRLEILHQSPLAVGSILETQVLIFKKDLIHYLKRQRSRVRRLAARAKGRVKATLALAEAPAAMEQPEFLPGWLRGKQPSAPIHQREATRNLPSPAAALFTPTPEPQGWDSCSTGLAPESKPIPAEPRKTVLWFGNHGTSYGQVGLENILSVTPALHHLNQSIPLRLRIVSNSYDKYLNLIEPLPFPTEYLEWHPTEVYQHIASSDVVIIPNSKSPFSICKSANRAILALSLGVPVVATKTPALAPFQDCILFDDWDFGLQQYLNQPEFVAKHIQQAQAMIESTYSGAAIARQWIHLLDTLQQPRYGQP
jgi:glycosyltransferase involved in cell wall biosynthesis